MLYSSFCMQISVPAGRQKNEETPPEALVSLQRLVSRSDALHFSIMSHLSGSRMHRGDFRVRPHVKVLVKVFQKPI